ncbi:MAG TPA: acyl-CoA dehydrogenase family protein [Acidimicrobiales bacterium]|jgi:acyl-CoA dehydrogenase|nr:acyl-CoA dehydrogenase family protein [Acidimicrobiales bacterium]
MGDTMSWDFETDADYQAKLDWADAFVREECEPVDRVVEHAWNMDDPVRQALVPPLQAKVREQGLWACHLGGSLGGPGYGQVKLALLNEILGRSHCAPIVFGCHAPDSGNAEILAHYGTPMLKERYLKPLLEQTTVSAYSMTEPRGGSDPTGFVTRAELDGDEWVINGEKWFSSHANFASFLVLLAVTEPDADRHKRMSMFIVPAHTPGVEIVRNVGLYGHDKSHGTHSYVRYRDVRIPVDHLLGERGQGFVVAQTRLGGGRIHHAMRTVGLVSQALDDMCERALSRWTQGELLAQKQLVQDMIAESWIQLEQFRLLVMRTAWRIDKYDDYQRVRADISAVKAAMPKVLHDVASRAVQIHGSLGVSWEMPYAAMVLESFHMGLADGATEVHKVTLARQILKSHKGTDDVFPTRHLPRLEAAARARFADVLEAV